MTAIRVRLKKEQVRGFAMRPPDDLELPNNEIIQSIVMQSPPAQGSYPGNLNLNGFSNSEDQKDTMWLNKWSSVQTRKARYTQEAQYLVNPCEQSCQCLFTQLWGPSSWQPGFSSASWQGRFGTGTQKDQVKSLKDRGLGWERRVGPTSPAPPGNDHNGYYDPETIGVGGCGVGCYFPGMDYRSGDDMGHRAISDLEKARGGCSSIGAENAGCYISDDDAPDDKALQIEDTSTACRKWMQKIRSGYGEGPSNAAPAPALYDSRSAGYGTDPDQEVAKGTIHWDRLIATIKQRQTLQYH
jgi:hypothetical protein